MSDLQADAPTQYTVVKGDTLWAISGRFLKEPWKWPQIWQMNRDQIKNPHLIYPGDVIKLDRNGSMASLTLLPGGIEGNVVRLLPRTRVEALATAVPSIPGNAIGPFLTQPLVLESAGLEEFPRIVATEEERVIVGAGNVAYATGIRTGDAVNWQIFRAGEVLTDPETGEILGYEANYLGDAKVKRYGNPATLEVTRARQEINTGDRLMPSREVSFPSYVPRAPDKPIKGSILTVQGGVSDFAQYSIVAINRGSRDGIEVGNVLATYRRGSTLTNTRTGRPSMFADVLGIDGVKIDTKPVPVVPDAVVTSTDPKAPPRIDPNEPIVLPDERSGLVFVFRTFEKISYALVMKSIRPISIGDYVQTP
ncbi:MAG: LysM peptidoglycan-binding domain-containing protein [Vicinamibacteria bacterium]|nr:LysM peptidoglycan-binding domain-containing protein [Vicinamibacteria bacterium]